ncbi:four-helix bundle copper-binding protein [Gemmata sp. JC717]|uniref:four-helix bundle copper-binding protein n=1 Tax=Gemmata algarum TaxID=2975278 RepID=UPI0021BB589A|nr:four-helix bundle copper-binding protein [Gemmata algarum]MDY3553813.1 four-helix bundle copper-binding protein [Gemmata algarum]
MIRTKLFGALGLLAVSFAVAGTAVSVGGKQPDTATKEQSKAADPHMSQFMDCAKECDDCARICNMCAAHCAKMVAEGKKEHLETVRTCIDCATICQSASAIVIKSGPFSDLICTACAEACKRCGDACEKHAEHDAIMKQCAAECRKCEKACRVMMKHTIKGDK